MAINQLKEEFFPVPANFHNKELEKRHSRLVDRSTGRPLIKYKNLPAEGWLGYISDGFTTLINANWYVILLTFTGLYSMVWLLFGFCWWGIDTAYTEIGNFSCVSNINGFASSFLFSIETQLTIGYGYRFISDECGVGILLLVFQSVVGLLVDSFLLGLVFSKITRPRKRRKTILFSEQACIYDAEDGQRYFEFRIADIRKSSLVEAHVRVQMYWYRNDTYRNTKILHESDIEVGYDSGRDRVIMLTPVLVRHSITNISPLYSLSSENLLDQDLEIVVILEAIVESTGLTVQALWSYTEQEIMYNYRFAPMTYRDSANGNKWEVDFDMISKVVQHKLIENNHV